MRVRRLPVGVGALGLALLFAGCPVVEPPDFDPDAREPDGSRAKATEQRVNSPEVYHTISSGGDEDWIRFRVTEPTLDSSLETGPLYAVYMPSLSASCYLDIYSRTGLVTPDGYLDNGVFKRFREPGIYCARVKGVSGELEYWLGIGMQKDDSEPDLAATGVSAPRKTQSGAEVLVVVRVVNQGGPYGDPFADADEFDVKLHLSDDRFLGGDTLLGTETVSGGLDAGWYHDVSFNVTMPGSPSGPVYLIAEADTAAEVMESDEDNNTAIGSTLLDAVADGGADDALAGATVIVPGVILPDLTLFPAGDVDCVKFAVAAAPVTYEIWTDNVRAGAWTKVEVLSFDGVDETLLASSVRGGLDNGAAYLSYDFTSNGDYYVRVSERSGSVGGYDLGVRVCEEAPDAYEFDDDVRTWKSLPTPTTQERTFSVPGDEDWAVLAVIADKDGWNYTIKTTSLTGCETRLYLRDANGQPIADTGSFSASGSELTLSLAAGLYYVGVTNNSGTAGRYKLEATAVAP